MIDVLVISHLEPEHQNGALGPWRGILQVYELVIGEKFHANLLFLVRPERWIDGKEQMAAANSIPGVYGHMMTFLGKAPACCFPETHWLIFFHPSGGPRACMYVQCCAWSRAQSLTPDPLCSGFRFAVVEIKAILFVLIRGFVFDLPTPRVEIEKKTS
jgi:hypothetical protein